MKSGNSSANQEKISDHALKDLVRARFTKTAEVFGNYAVAQRVEAAELLLRMVSAGPDDLAVDLASGPGTLALRFARYVRWICALDLTPAILVRARSTAAQEGLLKKLAFALSDAQALPLADGSLNIAVTSYSLHHISEPSRVINEMARVIKPGGRVGLIDIVVPEDPVVRALNHRIEHIRDHSHSRSLTHREFEEMMGAAGLRIIATEMREHPRNFDNWMHVAGWKRTDPEYIEARGLMISSIGGDGANFHPRFESSDPAGEPELYISNPGLYIAAEKM
jgi:ubiquinone/menaquinone biosynthesis C-methylase UbiE